MSRELSDCQRIERSLLTDFRKPIWRPFVRAVREYALIAPGDRIAVCVSGGKDSMLLAVLTRLLQRHFETPFEAEYLIMDPGYDAENRRRVEENAQRLGIPYTLVESDVFEASAQAGGDNPCFMCARMRRGCLYRHAQALGCNKIALGHHFNDVIETTLLSMFYGGQVQAMLPKLRAKHFSGMELIRPMYRVHEADILAWKDAHGLEFIQCACRFTEESAREAGRSKRQAIKALLEQLKRDNPNLERNLFGSIHTVQLDTLPGWKHAGQAHSFLEWYDALEGDD